MKLRKTWMTGALFAAGTYAALLTTVVADTPAEIDPRPAGGGAVAWNPPDQIDYIPKDLAVVYNLSGLSFLGQVHQHLNVYDNGAVSLTEIDPVATPAGTVQVANIDPEEVAALQDALFSAGAAWQADEQMVVVDLPMAIGVF